MSRNDQTGTLGGFPDPPATTPLGKTQRSPRGRLVLLAAILGSFVAFLDMSVVNVALPAIRRALGGGVAAQQWIVDAYLLSLSSLILIAGSVSDLFGRKRVFAAGLLGFGVTSLLCAAAPGSTFLIVARGLQGIAGALLVPSSLAMILSSFEGDAQGRAIGIWTAWTGIAFVVGPLASGLLVAAGWRWVFAINVLPIAATLLVVTRLPPDRSRPGEHPVDLLGAAMCAAGLGGLTFALIEQPRVGGASPGSGCRSRPAPPRWRRSCCGSAPRRRPCSTSRCFATATSPSATWRRWPSTPASARRPSCSRCFCSKVQDIRPSPRGWRCFR